MAPEASHITGTITQAWTSQDGVTHARVRLANREDVVIVRHVEPHADALIGRRVHHTKDGWTLQAGRAA